MTGSTAFFNAKTQRRKESRAEENMCQQRTVRKITVNLNGRTMKTKINPTAGTPTGVAADAPPCFMDLAVVARVWSVPPESESHKYFMTCRKVFIKVHLLCGLSGFAHIAKAFATRMLNFQIGMNFRSHC